MCEGDGGRRVWRLNSLKQWEDGPVTGLWEQKIKGSRWDRDMTIWQTDKRRILKTDFPRRMNQKSYTHTHTHSGLSLDHHLSKTEKTDHDFLGNYQSAAGGSCGYRCRWVSYIFTPNKMVSPISKLYLNYYKAMHLCLICLFMVHIYFCFTIILFVPHFRV